MSNAQRRIEYRRRMALLNEIKQTRGCADCGYDAHPAALDFDHRDPASRSWAAGRNMAANISRRWEVVLAEIAKCDVRCANCHRIRTSEEGHLQARSPLHPDPNLFGDG